MSIRLNRFLWFCLLAFLLSPLVMSSIGNAKLDSLQKTLQQNIPDTSKVNALNEIAQQLMHEDYTQSFKYAFEAIERAQKIKYEKGLGNAYHILGNLYDFNNADSSLFFLEKAKKIKKKLKDAKGLASTLIGIGTYYDKQSDSKNALDNYLQALRIFDSIKLETGAASACLGIGNVFQSMNNYKKAIEYYERSVDLYKKNNSPYLSWALNNLANSLDKIGERKRAVALYNESLQMKLEAEDYYGAVFSINNIGMIFMKENKPEEALKSFQSALAINRDKKLEPETFGNSYRNIASAYIHDKKPKNAISYIDSIYPIAVEIKNADLIEDYYKLKAEYFQLIGNFKEACTYKDKYIHFKDSTLTFDINKQVAEADAKYKSEKKQREIELLQRDNQINQLELSEKESRLQKQTFIIISIIAILILLFVTAFLLINRNRIKQRANEKLAATNEEIQKQKDIIEQKQKEIIDSIHYSKRIQQSLLPTEKYIEKVLNNRKKKS
ncbi:MAG: tetratricopeptide repeat protein [Bacteroidetes bacterium]|nr:tetratricopeptide repeat protein [Bacteroidota bacterium]